MEIEIKNNPINIEFNSPESLDVEVKTQTIYEKDHKNLDNLDYENSGHTGFASSKDIEDINKKISNLDNLASGIEVSSTKPVNESVILWYQTEQIEPTEPIINLDYFYLENNGDEIIINYQSDIGLDFNVVNNELIVTNNVEDLDFNITNNELEVKYG